MAQVQELRAIADEMSKNKTLTNAMTKAKSAWQGQTSDQFQQKCRELAGLISKEVTNIRKIADSLETSARAIAEAEQKAVEALSTNTIRK